MRFSTLLIMMPLAIIAAIVAIANRAPIPFRLDPFSNLHPALVIEAPLYLLLFIAFLAGAILGGVVVAMRSLTRGRKPVRVRSVDAALLPEQKQSEPISGESK